MKAKKIKAVTSRPLTYDLAGACALCKLLEVEMPEHRLKEWLAAKKEARRPQEARVLRTKWRNPRLLKARLMTTEEPIRVRVQNAAVFKAGAIIQVLAESEYMYTLDPDWNPKRRKNATRGRVRV